MLTLVRMPDRLILSRYRLATFAACRRRFQLRYQERLAWPAPPRAAGMQLAQDRGQAFHRLLERHFLGLPASPDAAAAADERLASWWRTFLAEGPALPAGRRLAEYTLTIPIGRHFLTGRFDLVVLTEGGAHIFDWKTEAHPRPEAVLRQDLQTLLYLVMVTEGAPALAPGETINPDQVQITYWYTVNPAASVTMRYSREQHVVNWRFLTDQVAALEAQLSSAEPVWPLTDNLAECAVCPFQVYCGRQQAGRLPVVQAADDQEPEEDAPQLLLEPDPL